MKNGSLPESPATLKWVDSPWTSPVLVILAVALSVIGWLFCLVLFREIDRSGPGEPTESATRSVPNMEEEVVQELTKKKVREFRGRELERLATHRARLVCESRFAKDVLKLIDESSREYNLYQECIGSLYTSERGKALTWSADGLGEFEHLRDACSEERSLAWVGFSERRGSWAQTLRGEWEIVNEGISRALDLPPLEDAYSPDEFHGDLLLLRTVAGKLIKAYRKYRHGIEQTVRNFESKGQKGDLTLEQAIVQSREASRKAAGELAWKETMARLNALGYRLAPVQRPFDD